ncbi:MAG: hypothetical protein NTW89_00440 [Burkholderiales bacterium]|nr:hypothetical protein [Burkholderiales bacterium]
MMQSLINRASQIRSQLCIRTVEKLRLLAAACVLALLPLAYASAQTVPLAFKHGDRLTWI